MRLTVLWLNPHRVAMARVLQCVASRGVASSVSVTICSTWASLMRRGAPGRGSASNPSSRAATNRLRHLPTVCLVRRSSRATRVFVRPLAHAKITRARCANACPVVGRRVQRSNASRSSSVSLSTGMGRPIAMRVLLSIARTLGPYMLFHLFQTHETSCVLRKRCFGQSSDYAQLPSRLCLTNDHSPTERSGLAKHLVAMRRRFTAPTRTVGQFTLVPVHFDCHPLEGSAHLVSLRKAIRRRHFQCGVDDFP